MTETQRAAMQAALDALKLAQENLRPHGDNCFLHDEGEFNNCFCGLDSLTSHLLAVTESLDSVLAASEPAPPHFDDASVDRFAAAMKQKMAASRAKGRHGWNDKELCTEASLQKMLCEHLAKGDPVDVGNFAMMLFNRGEKVSAPEPADEPVAKITGFDEYGPTLGWYTHWVEFDVGTQLFTSPQRREPQCKWPTCQSTEYQQHLANDVVSDLVGDQRREPLTRERVKQILSEAGYEDVQAKADFINGLRHGEIEHGIGAKP